MKRSKRIFRGYFFIFILIQTLVITMLMIKNRHDSVYGNTFVTIAFIIYILLESKFNFYTEDYIKILIAVVIICHSLFGELLVLYEASTIFDKVLHLFGTYSFSLFSYSVVNQLIYKPSASRKKEFIFITALGVSLGSFFEIIEFILDLSANPVVRYQTNLIDTDLDIIFNSIGAIAAALHMTVLKKYTNFPTH